MFSRRRQEKNEINRDQQIAEGSGKNIFTIGIYHGVEYAGYNALVKDTPIETIINLVQERALKDAQWCVDMDLVGDNEDVMRKMEAYVTDVDNIKRNYAYQINNETGVTVDFMCRDLANGSRWAK